MSINEAEMLEQQRQRRKRINKLKSIIIYTISIWMIVSFLSIVILAVQVVRLNIKVNKLEASIKTSQNTLQDTESNTGDTLIPSSEDVSSEGQTDDSSNVEAGIDTSDNIASEQDTRQVYLTFDCEPSENTELILDELKKYNIKATFFVSGIDSEEAKAICKRIVDDGHTIGMHSYSNRYSTVYNSTDSFESDLNDISNYILESTGIESKFYRFPGGSGNKISNVDMTEFVKILNNHSIKYFDWNVSAGDASGNYTVESVVNNVLEGVGEYKTSVVLLHDASDKSTTAESIGPLIEAIKDIKAEILPIDENTYVVQYIKSDSVE